jgi:hypothetical protein
LKEANCGFYTELEALGLGYGNAFTNVTEL